MRFKLKHFIQLNIIFIYFNCIFRAKFTFFMIFVYNTFQKVNNKVTEYAYVIISFPPKLYVTHSGHMISSSGLLLARRAASDCMFLSQYYNFFELWLVSGNKSVL